MNIDTDMLLEHALYYLCNHNKTINLLKHQKELKSYNKAYTRDTNIIISHSTYVHYFDAMEKMMPFIWACHCNSTTSYYSEKNNLNIKEEQKEEQTFDVLNLLNSDLTWEHFSSQFFYVRLFLLNNLCLTSFYSRYNIPTCLFPLFYSVIASINDGNNNWEALKEHILTNVYCFFHQFNGLISNQQHDKELTKDILPFSTKNIFAFYYVLLEHFFPNQLFELAESAQDALKIFPRNYNDRLKNIYFRKNMWVCSEFYSTQQTDYSVFSDIKKQINHSSSSLYTANVYHIIYPNISKADNAQSKTTLQSYSTKTALQQWTEVQKNLLNAPKSILANAMKNAEQKWEEKNQ